MKSYVNYVLTDSPLKGGRPNSPPLALAHVPRTIGETIAL
jgi:hypothetical protein